MAGDGRGFVYEVHEERCRAEWWRGRVEVEVESGFAKMEQLPLFVLRKESLIFHYWRVHRPRRIALQQCLRQSESMRFDL
jgi:hypothetical protein